MFQHILTKTNLKKCSKKNIAIPWKWSTGCSNIGCGQNFGQKLLTFLILLFLFVSPFFLPFVFLLSPRCVSPGRWSQCNESGWAFCAKTRARWWKTKASSVFTGLVYEPIRAIPRQEAVAPSMSLKMTYFLQSSTLWQFAPLLGPASLIPMQRVGVSVLCQNARALVENESEQRFHRAGLWTHQSYPQTGGSCAIYVPKNDLFFAIFYALAICPFAWPRKTDPTKPPEQEFFPEFPKGNLTLGGVRLPGPNPSGKLALRWFPFMCFLNIKLPFWDIDGATPTHSPKSGWECPHWWRNSLISPGIHQPT